MGMWKRLTSAPHEMGAGSDPAYPFFLLWLQLITCRLSFRCPSHVKNSQQPLSEVEIDSLHWFHLQDFKLEFGHHQGRTSSVWHGGTATIVESPGDEVWGIVWKMNTSNLSSLDKQEGVEDGIYVPIEVNVHTQAGKVLTCRSYQMKDYVCGPPSPQYKRVICMGAKQNGLPADYQKRLEAIETNNYAGPVPIMEEIEAAIKAKKINSA
uniref:gamma-glutamylcyclotransferase n=1 Tax=Accipiter nisus TaxID=211598 RepID=A0A8B9MW08_9AVES